MHGSLEQRRLALCYYLAFTYLALLVQMAFTLRDVLGDDASVDVFAAAVLVSYPLVYLAAVSVWAGVGSLLSKVAARPDRGFVSRGSSCGAVAFAVIGGAVTQLVVYADRTLYAMYGFHVNGFVLNLLTTEGGIESLGMSQSTNVTAAAIGAGFLALQGGLYALASRCAAVRRAELAHRDPKRLGVAVIAIATLFVAQSIGFAYAQYRYLAPVVTSARLVPFYITLSLRSFLIELGFERPPRSEFRIRADSLALDYPRTPLRSSPSAANYNIVWLVAESLRADALDPVVMPALDRFAASAARFNSHLSGGNGTRWGMFSMFYGLYGNDWFTFLDENRGPVLFDELIARGYDLEMFTSARFTYPEFASTIFARIPSDRLHEKNAARGEGWIRDRENVAQLLASLERRDRGRPFMRFLFFESPHANYGFPPESVVKTPYLEDFNYLTTDPARARVLLENRYSNSCHHLDSQLERIFRYLEDEKLLDSTIVVVTGDHGEEFMEAGRWGHNSQFSDSQIHVPLVIRIPGRAPETIQRLTSHLDLPATVLAALGIENDASDFSLGHDLFGPFVRHYTVVSNWDEVAYVDDRLTATFAFSGFAHRAPVVRDRAFALLPESRADALLHERRPQVLEMLAGLHRFHRTARTSAHAPGEPLG